MQEIKDLKTRDYDILCETIREMSDSKKGTPVWDIDLLLKLVKRIPEDTYLIYCNEIDKYVFTNLLDDDLVYQEYFCHSGFVIVETDVCLAVARGIHYRYHKKVRP